MKSEDLQDESLEINTYPITNGPGHTFTKHIGEMKVQPHEEPHLSLGVFSDQEPPKGFSTEISPISDLEDSVVTQFTPLKKGKQYELFLHVANFGNQPISVDIWAI